MDHRRDKGSERVLIYATFSNRDEATRIVDILLNERLIACANLWPISSSYWWKGKIETAEEVAAIMKTQAARYQLVEQRIIDLHSYEIPAVVAFPIRYGLSEYLAWITQETCV